MGSVLFRRCPPPGPAQPAAGADFYLMLEYRGGEITQRRDVSLCHDQQLSILCFEINGWVCLPLVVLPTLSSGQLSQCRDIGKYSHSHLVLGGVSVLNMLRPGRGPGCKCVNWTVGRVSRFYPVTNLYLILNMDPEYGINLYCQPFRHLINENK